MIRAVTCLCLCAATAFGQDYDFGISQREQVSKGLVAYWAMRNSGTTVYDEQTNAINATAVNGPSFSYANGVVGNGASFYAATPEASGDYMQCGNSAILKPTAAITVSAWVKPTSISHLAAEYPTIASDYGTAVDASTGGLKWTLRQKDAKLEWYLNSGTFSALTVTGYFSAGAWVHVAATYENGVGRALYKDGALAGSGAYSGALITTTNNVEIGRGYDVSTQEWWNGTIDEVRIYNRALSADEIKQLYRMGKTIFNNR
jgi:hypothetical protein